MRVIRHSLLALGLAATCASALAQLPFGLPSLPGIGRSSDSGSSPSIGSMLGNLVKATKQVEEPEEISIGQEFAATLVGAKPLVNDPRLQRYVNTLGRWLALQTERPDLPWTFGVLDDPGFNAFATPGGYVFVTRGLVERMRNEAELAGVLAHEIGHVLQKHHLKAVTNNARFALVTDSLSAANKSLNGEAKSLVANAARNIFAKGLDKDDEYEADRLGVVIAARAGYDPYGLPAVLQMLQAQNPNDGGFSLLFRTHPLPGARLELLDRTMRDRFDAVNGVPGKPVKERLAEFAK